MELLEQRILRDGKIKPGGILKVDSFLNHQIDPALLYEMALELKRLFGGEGVNKIFTIEASGDRPGLHGGLCFLLPAGICQKKQIPQYIRRCLLCRGGVLHPR